MPSFSRGSPSTRPCTIKDTAEFSWQLGAKPIRSRAYGAPDPCGRASIHHSADRHEVLARRHWQRTLRQLPAGIRRVLMVLTSPNYLVASLGCFVAVQSRGTVALPPILRKRYNLDRPGAQVEITEREDGVLELRPAIAVPAAEAWFWDERWQAGEREVDEHVVAGETKTHDTVDDFIAHLSTLDSE